jgi:putative transposase
MSGEPQMGEVCKHPETSEPTWHRWVARYGGVKADGAT